MHSKTIRVLLIEDDTADFLLIKRCLNKAISPFELQRAATLREGLDKLDQERFEVVLTDLSLPDSQWLEAVTSIRQRQRSLPIVVLTTLDDSEIELKSLNVGAQDYLLKNDATPCTLERAIHHAVQRQENLEQIERLLAEVQDSRELLAEQKQQLESNNRRLRELYQTAHRFVDNVSHEFRTPLTVIKDYVTLVREGIVGEVNDEQSRMLDVAGVRVDDLNNMVDDMLDVSKLESGLLGISRRRCRIADIIELARNGLDKKADVKGIQFTVEVDDDLPAVYCDGEKVSRVIINLVTNAMKFCGDPGVVKLWVEADFDQHEIQVAVSDNGPGIADEALAEIFRRFRQLQSGLKSSTKGFGLGLNIAKELVDLNYGTMNVESAVGKGSTFSFSIPFDQPVEVVRRYLQRAKQVENSSPVVCLVRCSIDAEINEAVGEDLEAFFNFLLGQNDLLFRCPVDDWLFLLAASASEVELFIAQAADEWQKTNRNRPHGPLPAFELQPCGSWRLSDQSEQFLLHLQESTESMPASPITG